MELNKKRKIPEKGEVWKHFTNKLYKIIAIAEHTETKEKLVIYRALYGAYGIHARPLEMFMSKTDLFKHPEAEQEFRFALVRPGYVTQQYKS